MGGVRWYMIKTNLCVTCLVDNWYAENFHVSIIDCFGKVLFCKATDERGKSYFSLDNSGNYQIKITGEPTFTPQSATRWVKICKSNRCHQTFIFKRTSQNCMARLNIHLTDEFYPEYKLDQGEYELWLKY